MVRVYSFIEGVTGWMKDSKWWLLYLLAIVVLSFTYELFNFTLSADEELLATISYAHPEWIAQGRWPMYFLSYLFLPSSIVPFSTLFITLLASAVSYSIIVHIFSKERGAWDYFAAPLFIACPILYHVYTFSTLNFGIGIGMLLASIGMYIWVHESGRRQLWSIPFFAFVIGIYQVFLFWLIILFGFYLVGRLLEDMSLKSKKVAQLLCTFLFHIGIALVLYHSIRLASYFLVQPSPYLETFLSMPDSIHEYGLRLVRTLMLAGGTYLGVEEIYVYKLPILGLLLLMSIGIFIYGCSKSNATYLRKISLFIFLGVLLCLPFVLNLFSEYVLPLRILIGVPLVLSGLCFFAYRLGNRHMRLVLGVLMILTSIQFSILNNRLSFADALSWQRDRELTVQIATEVTNVSHGLTARRIPLVTIGGYSMQKPTVLMNYNEYSILGTSFYALDGSANVSRVIGLMYSMGIDRFVPASIEQQRIVMETANKMPLWPQKGSIKLVEGIVIVKFGNYDYNTLVNLCGENRFITPVCRIEYATRGNKTFITEFLPNDLVLGEKVYQLKEDLLSYVVTNTPIAVTPGEERISFSAPEYVMIPLNVENIHEYELLLLQIDLDVDKPGNLSFLSNYPDKQGEIHEDLFRVSLQEGNNKFSLVIPSELGGKSFRLDLSGNNAQYTINELNIISVQNNL